MEYVFRIIKKVTDMERPTRNTEEILKVYVEKGETFQDDGKNGHVFKLLSGDSRSVMLEYDREYLVKNEHKAYEYVTNLAVNESKQITSMWSRLQTTITITYLGVEGDISSSQNNLKEEVNLEEDN
ncbi:MAG: hypothetical protein WCY27_03565 [archaeon]|jgi:hypothetical protein|nr:hypothetical protein [archaeon]MDD2477703.1 hypothetical protein [Candidatus ainarchaeum sp.]MDD3084556.1 hypothetical protein [Candidatus ainarchaeum sp.]MDD4221280.1 hypothetical protein [Candidatus ainarchaeum sp.]MDD4662787.1 hypothetical protein [Candidatus ainarchaeum sp.]